MMPRAQKAIVVCALLFFLGVVGVIVTAAEAGAQEDKHLWKVGTLTPKGVGWARQFEEIILPVIHQATDNNLEVMVYWGGVMGDDRDIISKMRAGQLQAAGITGQGAVIVCPEFAIVGLPFLFDNYDEVDYVREKMLPVFAQLTEQRGFKLLLWLDQDFDQIYSRRWSFRDIRDFQKARFMSWYGAMEEQTLRSLGASPVPVDVPELVPSMRQGVGDSMIAPGLWMIATQLYASVKYMVPIRIRYSPAMVVTTMEAWNALPEKSRQGLLEAVPEVTRRFTAATRIDNQKAIDALAGYGLEKVELSPEAIGHIREKTLRVWDEQAGLLYPREILDEVRAHLDDFRSRPQ